MNPYAGALYERKASGSIVVDGQEVGHTMQCRHCGAHFLSVKGSGKTRGWCMKCAGVLCGAEACFACVPFEKRLEIEEKKYAEHCSGL